MDRQATHVTEPISGCFTMNRLAAVRNPPGDANWLGQLSLFWLCSENFATWIGYLLKITRSFICLCVYGTKIRCIRDVFMISWMNLGM